MPHGNPILNNGSWDTTPAREVELDKPNNLGVHETHRKLQTWWLAVIRGNPTTPNWDIASTCKIRGKPGLLFIEAKAHEKELSEQNECGSRNSENRERILEAIAGASVGLASVTGDPWNISRDHHYQLSNRVDWSWKLVSLGIPVTGLAAQQFPLRSGVPVASTVPRQLPARAWSTYPPPSISNTGEERASTSRRWPGDSSGTYAQSRWLRYISREGSWSWEPVPLSDRRERE